MLRFRVAYHHLDYNGEMAETGYTVADVSSVQALDTFLLANESIIQALSDAPIVSALAHARLPPYVPPGPPGPASVHNRLLCLFTDGPRFGSFVIPAARGSLNYELAGPYAGIRVQQGSNYTADRIALLQTLLADTLLPDGSPFPTGQWVAAKMAPTQ